MNAISAASAMTKAYKGTKDKFRTRFEDANEAGVLIASRDEVNGVIRHYLTEKMQQKGRNRALLVKQAEAQIKEAVRDVIGYGAFLDWRGRLYYHGAGIAPQGKDFGRGCLEAATGVRLGVSGLRHLMAGVATTWGQGKVKGVGIDKARIRDRVAFVRKMVRDGSLRRIVNEAVSGEGFEWRLAEEPVQFLALAVDLLAALDSGNPFEYRSKVFVGYDATCSGLQILAALCGDEATAALVNVKPREDGERADIYMASGEAMAAYVREFVATLDEGALNDAHVFLAQLAEAEEEIRAAREEGREPDEEILSEARNIPAGDHWAVYWQARTITRAIMKTPVMVYCYGGGMRTFAGAFREETGAPWGACLWLAAVLFKEVLPKLLPRAHAFMLALQEMARALADKGKAIEFVTTDGLPFRQEVFETEKDQPRCWLLDGRQIKPVVYRRTKKLSKQKQASGIAPNLVHSWDALFLRNVVRALADAGIDCFFTVHDCFYLRPGDWARGWKIIRETFVKTFEGDVARAVVQQIEDRANGYYDRSPEAEAWENEGGAVRDNDPVKLVDLMSLLPPKGSLDLRGALKSEFLFS